MKNNLVSIIVPIYNAEKYLQELLNSINSQTFANYEVILINDGSTDDSEKICRKNSETNSKIRYFQKKNTGVSDTRNYGIKKATGKYICFVDADDVLNKDYLKDLVDAISLKDYGLSCCEYKEFSEKIFNEEDCSISIEEHEYAGEDRYQLIYSKYRGYLWNKMFIRDIITKNNIKFDKDIFMSEDMLFIFEYLKYIDKVICINKKNYNYRIINNSASKNVNNMKWFSIFKMLDKIIYDKKFYSQDMFNKVMYSYLYYLYEAKYRLKHNKENNNYFMYKDDIKNRIKKVKEYKYNLSFKEKIKIFIYKYFNTITFDMKKGR